MTARLRILSWLLRRGKRLLQVQQWHASRGCFEQMLRLSEPGSRSWRLARVYLARIAERFGNREEARGHIRQLLRCQPGEARWHYRLGRLWRKEQRPDCWQRALRHLRLAVKRSPDRAAYWAELGRCLADAGKPRLALRYLHRAWSLAPHSLRYLAWLLELLLACDRFAEAERLVQQARLLHRDNAAIGDLRRRCQLHILLARQQSQSASPAILPFFRLSDPSSATTGKHDISTPNRPSREPLSEPVIIRMDLPQSVPPVQLHQRG
jgi:tetratricopeptide (TPR) repeat protein